MLLLEMDLFIRHQFVIPMLMWHLLLFALET